MVCKIFGCKTDVPIIEAWASKQGRKRSIYLCRRCLKPVGENTIMDDFQSEQEFVEQLDTMKILSLTRAEALFLSDSMTLLLEHDKDDKSFQIPARSIKASATVSVSVEMITRVGLAVLLTTDPKNQSRTTEMPISMSELYILRECCQSFVTYGDELVGYNLIRKIYKLLLEDSFKQRKFIERITSDLDLSLEDIVPKIDNKEENSNADRTTKDN